MSLIDVRSIVACGLDDQRALFLTFSALEDDAIAVPGLIDCIAQCNTAQHDRAIQDVRIISQPIIK
jgi:hypothetical protein